MDHVWIVCWQALKWMQHLQCLVIVADVGLEWLQLYKMCEVHFVWIFLVIMKVLLRYCSSIVSIL